MANSSSVGSELDERIIRQVEYYFGDFNLPRDKFLQEQIKLDDGWIPLSTMLNFKRLAALTTDQDLIINALKKSPMMLMEIDEEQKKIRRSSDKPVPVMNENRQKEIQSRTVYCKGFSKENSSLDKLLEYFSQYGSIENVQMRSYLDKATKEYIFKGSVFVVFSSKDEMDEFLKKETVEYEGVPLIVKRQENYFIDKKKEREDKKKMQKAKLQQITGKQPSVKKEKDVEENDSEEEEEKTVTGFPKGAVLHIKGVPSDAAWEDIKSAVETVWKAGAKEGEDEEVDVAYVDYHMGDQEGWIRLAEAGSASVLLQRAKRVALVKDNAVDLKKGTGDGKEDDKKAVNGGDSVTVKECVSDGVEARDSEVASVEDKVKEEKDSVVRSVKEGPMEAEDAVKVKEEGEMSAEDSGLEGNSGGEMKVNKDAVAKSVKEEPVSAEEEVAQMEVCGVLVELRVLRGSEDEAYLEKAQGARERRFMSVGKGRNRGGGRRGGGRKGRGNRGGKRKCSWDGGSSNKRAR